GGRRNQAPPRRGRAAPRPARPARLQPPRLVAAAGPLLRPFPLPRPRRRLGRADPPHPRPDPARRPVHGPGARRGVRRADLQLWGGFPVTPTRSASTPAAEPAGWFASWGRFWFTPTDPVGLHAVRVGAGLLLLCWLLPLAGQLDAFFGLQGSFDRQADSDVPRLPMGPQQPIGWSVLYLCGNNATLLRAAYWLAVGVIVLFTLGLWPRLTGVLTWLAVLSFAASPAVAFDADTLLVILAF